MPVDFNNLIVMEVAVRAPEGIEGTIDNDGVLLKWNEVKYSYIYVIYRNLPDESNTDWTIKDIQSL